jgi:hypothetical protein
MSDHGHHRSGSRSRVILLAAHLPRETLKAVLFRRVYGFANFLVPIRFCTRGPAHKLFTWSVLAGAVTDISSGRGNFTGGNPTPSAIEPLSLPLRRCAATQLR